MTRYFGTDGVRAAINTGPMTAENIVRLALAAGRFFMSQKHSSSRQRPLVVIGKDTRLSGYMVEAALQAGFASIGMDTRLLGPLPTPAVANLTRSLRADLGVMISASHNPHHDNGIKLFGPDGYKLPDTTEDQIASIMDEHIVLAAAADLGRAKRMQDGLGRYIEQVKGAVPRNQRFSNLKVVVDCANGAAYRAAPDVLFEMGAEVIPIAISPDGFNINHNCGAVHPMTMAEAVVTHQADIGLALDGDADRLIMADEKGQLINGDQCLAVIADMMRRNNTLKGNTVVGTLMTNHGLGRYLAESDIELMRTKVGDRYILDAMRQHDLNLGGEPSGHVLMTDVATSGDGLMTGLVMLSALMMADKPASQALQKFTETPQILLNIRAMRRPDITKTLEDKAIKEAIQTAQDALGASGRVVVRPSGTEPLLRIMVEAEDKSDMQEWANQLEAVITNTLNAVSA
ncbi:MAG TPA: phosphoglucosamine mutase [Alphaproteobacteria bacterium]|nr:phosphoglucosamine mutase [Alphaproteobacteria bacterium]